MRPSPRPVVIAHPAVMAVAPAMEGTPAPTAAVRASRSMSIIGLRRPQQFIMMRYIRQFIMMRYIRQSAFVMDAVRNSIQMIVGERIVNLNSCQETTGVAVILLIV